MFKRFISYYGPEKGLFIADTVCALTYAGIDLAFPIILRALPEALREVADYRMLAYSVLLIVIMLLNASPKFAELKGRWSVGNILRMRKANKEKEGKENG